MNIQSAKIKNKMDSKEPSSIIVILETGVQMSIPFDPANTDFANFKLDLADGVELQDADGNTMSPEEVAEFLTTLP